MADDDGVHDFLMGLARCGEHLASGEDFPLEVVVLRGHLLIEEELKALLRKRFERPEAYDTRRTRFSEATRLVEALYGTRLPEWEWKAIREVNVVRNSLAHVLEDETVEARIRRLFKVFADQDPTFAYADSKDLATGMQYCVSHLHTSLLRIRTE